MQLNKTSLHVLCQKYQTENRKKKNMHRDIAWALANAQSLISFLNISNDSDEKGNFPYPYPLWLNNNI